MGLHQETLELIALMKDIARELQPISVRGMAYQLFNRKLITNMGDTRQTKRVSEKLTLARERGDIPWEWIVDETRDIEVASSWTSPSEYAETVADAFVKDLWADQPERLMVISEKGTVGGLVRPVTDELRVPFFVAHGWNSATFMHALARASVVDDRPLTFLYIGDHDPSGRRMSDEDLPTRLARYGGRAEFARLTIQPEDITAYNLPAFRAIKRKPGKKRDDPNYF
jgi:hypothetical protein